MRQRVICGLLLIVLAIMYIWSNDQISFYLFIAMASCVVLSIILNQIAGRRLQVAVVTERSKEKANGKIELHMKNSMLIPIFQVRVDLRLQNMLTDSETKVSKRYMLFPFEERSEIILFDSQYCGKIETDLLEVRCIDAFGLSSYKGHGMSRGHFYCYPQDKEIDLLIDQMNRSQNPAQEIYLHRKGNDPTEVLDLRDYERGDSVKMIHWKLSHKLGKKVVRELDMPSNQDTLIVFGISSEITELKIHKIVEDTLAVSQHLLRQDIHHDVLLLDRDGNLIRTYSVEGQESFSWFEKRLLTGEINVQRDTMDSYLQQVDLIAHYATVLYITDVETKASQFAETVSYVSLP